MTKNNSLEKEISFFTSVAKNTSIVFFVLIGLVFTWAFFKAFGGIVSILIGLVVSFTLSCLNLYFISLSFRRLAYEKQKPKLLFLPILSFLALVFAAYLFKSSTFLLIGFVLGLTAPLLFGLIWVFSR